MKVGILTFHCAHNYGAMLQAYATQELLRGAGHQVEVIDYRPSYLTDPYRWFSLSRVRKADGSFSIKHLLAELCLLPVRYIRYARFDSFMTKRLNLSGRVRYESFTGDYDVIVIGSDQVWNLRQMNGRFDRMYLADFPFDKNSRRYVADAVSLEPDLVDSTLKEELSCAIARFDALSAREIDMVGWLDSLTTKKFVHIQDPVFHIDPHRWYQFASPVSRRRPYLLVYRMAKQDKIDPFISHLAEDLHIDIVEVQSSPEATKLFSYGQTVSVEDFLGLIANAAFVITSSFHGTAFSLIFRRQFYYFTFGNNKDLRVKSLLESLDLTDRMLEPGASVAETGNIDYDEVDAKISILRKASAEFVLNAVSDMNGPSDACKVEKE